MNRFSVRQLVIIALLTGLVAVATMVIQIPNVATGGFVNFGDTFIFISSILFGPISGFIAGGIGSSMANVLGGHGQWAPFTLVIKSLEGLICGYLFLMLSRSSSIKSTWAAGASMIIAGLWMVTGYFFAGAFLTGSFAVAAVGVPGDIVQAVVSTAVALTLLKPLKGILRK